MKTPTVYLFETALTTLRAERASDQETMRNEREPMWQRRNAEARIFGLDYALEILDALYYEHLQSELECAAENQ